MTLGELLAQPTPVAPLPAAPQPLTLGDMFRSRLPQIMLQAQHANEDYRRPQISGEVTAPMMGGEVGLSGQFQGREPYMPAQGGAQLRYNRRF